MAPTSRKRLVESEFPSGRSSKIAFLGEAPGEEEEHEGRPMVGPSGRLLNLLCGQTGIRRSDTYVGNVFRTRPAHNKVGLFFAKRAQAKREKIESAYPFYDPHGFLRPEHEGEIERLKDELWETGPNVIVALGNTALWALTGLTKITQHRGTILESTLLSGVKVLPTFHPAAIIRNWGYFPFVVADLLKAKKESQFKEIRRPERTLYIQPSLQDIRDFIEEHVRGAKGPLSVDIETGHQQVTCIGIAPSSKIAMTIPFLTRTGSYWPTAFEEVTAWKLIQNILEDPTIPKLFQNGAFDITYLTQHGIHVKGEIEDTMLLHHSLQPEMEKGLGVLASLYTNERSWKHFVNHTESPDKQDG